MFSGTFLILLGVEVKGAALLGLGRIIKEIEYNLCKMFEFVHGCSPNLCKSQDWLSRDTNSLADKMAPFFYNFFFFQAVWHALPLLKLDSRRSNVVLQIHIQANAVKMLHNCSFHSLRFSSCSVQNRRYS